jgi:alanine dehydrogenase
MGMIHCIEGDEIMQRIGIRHETKSPWEGRVPIVPADMTHLIEAHGMEFQVQRSDRRAFGEDAYAAAGATIVDELHDCPIIIGVKEIPEAAYEPDTVYLNFSHTMKGQPENMPVLQRVLDLNCTMLDFELITNEQGQRLVAFGEFAGLAGMIDTLWTLGRRLGEEGIESPMTQFKAAHQYDDLAHAKREIEAIGRQVAQQGIPEAMRPMVIGFAGYGRVSQGAQEVFEVLPHVDVQPDDLPHLEPRADAFYKVVFKEEHLVKRIDAAQPFELQEYYTQPELYEADFMRHAPHLHVLVNCIYWEPKYPKLITRAQFRELFANANCRLRVIGDITCDIDGSLECTTHSTEPGNPVYVYDPTTGDTIDGVAGRGPVVLAVDFLPCEIPKDASAAFSAALRDLMPSLGSIDRTQPLERSGLHPALQRATMAYNGRLTEPYLYLQDHLPSAPVH